MEYVCVGGDADGARVSGSYPPKSYYNIPLLKSQPLVKVYDPNTAISPPKIVKCSYRLECIAVDDANFYFYVDDGLDMKTAIRMLIENYAIGDPTK